MILPQFFTFCQFGPHFQVYQVWYKIIQFTVSGHYLLKVIDISTIHSCEEKTEKCIVFWKNSNKSRTSGNRENRTLSKLPTVHVFFSFPWLLLLYLIAWCYFFGFSPAAVSKDDKVLAKKRSKLPRWDIKCLTQKSSPRPKHKINQRGKESRLQLTITPSLMLQIHLNDVKSVKSDSFFLFSFTVRFVFSEVSVNFI